MPGSWVRVPPLLSGKSRGPQGLRDFSFPAVAAMGLLERLIESPVPWIRAGGAQHPKLTGVQRARYLEQARNSPYVSELTEVAGDTATPPAILAYLAHNQYVRWPVASNPATPRTVLLDSTRSPDAWTGALASERLK